MSKRQNLGISKKGAIISGLSVALIVVIGGFYGYNLNLIRVQ